MRFRYVDSERPVSCPVNLSYDLTEFEGNPSPFLAETNIAEYKGPAEVPVFTATAWCEVCQKKHTWKVGYDPQYRQFYFVRGEDL